MANAAGFHERWNAVRAKDGLKPDKFYVSPRRSDRIANVDNDWLTKVGLPGSAFFLSFDDLEDNGLFPLTTIWGQLDFLSADEQKRLDDYLYVGEDGGGNPVCIDAQDSHVYILDHEDRFRPYALVASSCPQLAELLLAYQEIAQDFGERHSSTAREAIADFEADYRRTLVERMTAIDAAALAEGEYWLTEVSDFFPWE